MRRQISGRFSLPEEIGAFLRRAGDLVYPPRCPICQRLLRPAGRTPAVCTLCLQTLPWNRGIRCLKCGRPMVEEQQALCPDCRCREHAFVRGASIFCYEGALRESVLRMKFHNHREYLPFYAWAMAGAYPVWLRQLRPAVLLPVPMHPAKRAQRGFDQCALLAEALSKRLQIPAATGSVRRIRRTRPQKGLDREERVRNLAGAFLVTAPHQLAEPILIVDDIYTTGATMDALAHALKEAGFSKIYFLTLCSGRT